MIIRNLKFYNGWIIHIQYRGAEKILYMKKLHYCKEVKKWE